MISQGLGPGHCTHSYNLGHVGPAERHGGAEDGVRVLDLASGDEDMVVGEEVSIRSAGSSLAVSSPPKSEECSSARTGRLPPSSWSSPAYRTCTPWVASSWRLCAL